MPVGVKQNKKKPKTPGRDYGVAPIGAAASRIDAEAGIGSFNPFNQPFNNPNMYNAAVPMIPRSAGNPQLGMYAMPPMMAPQEQPVDPMLEELAREQAMSVMGMANNDGSQDGIAQINMPTEPLSNQDGTTDQAAAIRRAIAMRANPDYQRYLAAAQANQNFDFALPPMQTTAPSGGGMSAKEFRSRVGAQATKNQAARAADPTRMAVTERAKGKADQRASRMGGRVGVRGVGADAVIADGLARGNKEQVAIGIAMKQMENQAGQQVGDNAREDRKVDIMQQQADNEMLRYKADAGLKERELAVQEPPKPGSAGFVAAGQVAAEPFRGLAPKDVYGKVGPMLDALGQLKDPTAQLEYAGRQGLTPDVLRVAEGYRPGVPYGGDERLRQKFAAENAAGDYGFMGGVGEDINSFLFTLPWALGMGESGGDYQQRVRRGELARQMMQLLGAGQAAR